jgi:Fic family protein
MDAERFNKASPGVLVRIPPDIATGNNLAFLPYPLPPDWEFPARLWPLLGEAKQQLGLLEGIGRTLPNPAILLRHLEDREAIQSSRLEGTYVTATELLVYELNPQESQAEAHRAIGTVG